MVSFFKNKSAENEIRDSVGILGFQGGFIFNEDGSIAVGYQLNLLQEESISKEQYINIINTFSAAVSKLPLNTVLQKFDIYFNDEFNIKIDESLPLLHRNTLSYYNGNKTLLHKSYIFLSFNNREYNPNNTFLGIGKHYVKQTNTDYKKEQEKIEKICNAFIDSMPEGMSFKRLNDKENNTVVHQYLSLNFNKEVNSLENTITNTPNCTYVGTNCLNIISMTSQSDEPKYYNRNNFGNNGVTSSFIWPLTHFANYPHILTQTIRIIDSEKFMKEKYRSFEVSSAFKINRRSIALAEELEEEFLDLEKTIKEQDDKIVIFNINVALWDTNKSLLNEKVNQTLSSFNKIGITSKVETLSTCNLFFSNIPGCGGQLYKGCPMALSTASTYINWNTTRRGDKEKELILCDRHGSPLYYDPFKYTLDNQHAFVFGPSGSGKSFFNGKLIKDRYFAGHTVVVIDSGRTYSHLFKILGGKYVEYQPNKPLKLNPFLIKKTEGKYKPDTNKIAFLVQFIGKIWKGDLNKNPLTEVEYALLSKFLTLYYQDLLEDQIPNLTSFCNWLKNHLKSEENFNKEILNIEEFFLILEPFTMGIYKDHFNADEVEYVEDSKLICFELETIKSNAKLYPLVVQVLFDFVLQIVANQPNAKKFIDIEEGWTMLNDSSQDYIESFFRKGRKTNTSIRIITQNVDEIRNSPIAGAMKNNASTFILLYNDKESVRQEIGEFLGMNEFDMEKYASMRRKDGLDSYREVFIKEMNDSYVWQVKTSLFEYGLLTSRPDERNRIDELIQAKGDIKLAIGAWMNEKRVLLDQ